MIEACRADVVADHRDEWSSHLKVTVCLADGAPARISALNAATRSYRPDYLHVWRTKTFWDTQTLSEEDVESHTFKKLEMRPATHRSQLEVCVTAFAFVRTLATRAAEVPCSISLVPGSTRRR